MKQMITTILTYDAMIKDAIVKFLPGYDWRMYKAQLWNESGLNPKAVSLVGARGIAQFIPDTWNERSGPAGYPGADPFDPEAGIFTGAHYMAWLLKQWKSPRPEMDRICLALASYNSGLGGMLRAQEAEGMPAAYKDIVPGLWKVKPKHAKEPIDYVQRIMKSYIQLVTGA